MIRGLSYLAPLLFLAPSTASFGQDLQRPAEWRVRTDDPAADPDADLWFVSMPPGWHITAGVAAILWDPSRNASGSFRIEAEAYRFTGESAEGYGILLGGSDLETDSLRYLAFLVDRDARYRIYHRAGDELHEIQPWTKHEAVVGRDPDPASANAKNVLAVEAGTDSLRFEVNGETVAAYARVPSMEMDGQIGLRVHEGVDVHVTRLVVVDPKKGSS